MSVSPEQLLQLLNEAYDTYLTFEQLDVPKEETVSIIETVKDRLIKTVDFCLGQDTQYKGTADQFEDYFNTIAAIRHKDIPTPVKINAAAYLYYTNVVGYTEEQIKEIMKANLGQ